MTPLPLDASGLPDLTAMVQAGDHVVVGQGTAEPLTLTAALVAQHRAVGRLDVFLGATFSDTFVSGRCEGIAFSSYGAIGKAALLARSRRLNVTPVHYSELPALFETRQRRVDVALLLLAPGPDGRPANLALANDYTVAAARSARIVIAEVNRDLPAMPGGALPSDLRIDAYVESTRGLLDLPPRPADGLVESRIAAHVAAIIPDGAVLQIGIGGLPDAVLAGLRHHRELGIHSGMIGDRVVDLIECGAVTDGWKPFDRGVTIAGLLLGSERLRRFADRNPRIRLAPPAYTHAHPVLARIPFFTAINSAIEVDLTGQVNAEVAEGTYIGALGGQADFVRGARAAAGGRSIIALPATAKDGRRSRIVAALSGPVTTSRGDADTVVTECGVAELRGCSLRERARRMIAIAAPAFREELERAAASEAWDFG